MRRLLLTSLLCAASAAFAQEELSPPPPAPVEPQPVVVVEPVPATKLAPPVPTARERRGGTVGVGYLGLASMLPMFASLGGLGGLGGLGSLGLRVNVPMLGVRWWMRGSRLGLDFGVGAMLTTNDSNSPAVAFFPPSFYLVAHVGLPIAVASTQHVIVLLAPEFRAGFTTLTGGGSGFTSEGSLLELALRGGIELFFSFIGVPELSLEAAVRLGVARDAQSVSTFSPLGPGFGSSTESFRFSTSLSGDAASIIGSTLSLKYYF